jgi:hypothetical protein
MIYVIPLGDPDEAAMMTRAQQDGRAGLGPEGAERDPSAEPKPSVATTASAVCPAHDPFVEWLLSDRDCRPADFVLAI